MARPGVRDVGRVLSMYVGPDDALVTMDLDFDEGTDTADAALAMAEVERRASVVHARVGDLLDAHLQRRFVLLDRLLQVGRGRHLHRAQRIALAASKTLHQLRHQGAALRRPQSLLATTCCSMALSRLRSVTICLSLRFSSSSWRSRRNSGGPTPPYFLRQT